MKKLLEQSSKLGQDDRFQGQYKGKENENTVTKQRKKEEKKRQPNK